MLKRALFANILVFLLIGTAYSQSINLVHNKQSSYVIVIPKESPQSIRTASAELQKCIEIASGVKVPIKFDTEEINDPFISLGKTRYAPQYDDIEDNGYCIVTKNKNIFIIGNDSPDGQTTKYGGTTNGTSNGVYSFLEDYLSVRWLMPGDLGRDVPIGANILLPEIDVQYTPSFAWRRLSNLQDFSDSQQKQSVQQWMDFQKLGSNYDINYQHNWDWIRKDFPDIYQKHPEWFAFRDGKRQEPIRSTFKLETTNPQMVNFFADRAISELKRSTKATTFSLSPNDDRFWSESPESRKYYDPAPHGRDHQLVTRLVLKWYNDVAEAVGKRYPQGRLAGYLYSDYFFPPPDGNISFPKNFIPVVTGTPNYGYKLFRQENREMLSSALDGWSKANPSFWIYFDMPNQLFRQDMSSTNNYPGTSGIVTPTGVKILDFLFPQLIKSRFNGASLYGSPSWTNSAVSNYVLAKMLWDPSLRASALQKEWLVRAYGADAGKVMLSFYQELERRFENYFLSVSSASYKLTEDMMKKIYADNYSELEHIFSRAKSQEMSSRQAERLKLLEANIAILQWRLKSMKLLPSSYNSEFTKDDKSISELIAKQNDDFQSFPGIVPIKRLAPKNPKYKINHVSNSKELAKPKLSNAAKSTYLIYALGKQKVTINPEEVNQGLLFSSYIIKNEREQEVASGVMMNNIPITFEAQSNTQYYLHIPSRKDVTYRLSINGASVIKGTFAKNSISINSRNKKASLLVQNISGKSTREMDNKVIIN